jgi:hypothetical protein
LSQVLKLSSSFIICRYTSWKDGLLDELKPSLRELSKRLGIKEVVSLCDKFISNLKTKFPKDSMNSIPESEECEDINTAICPKGLQFEESVHFFRL